MQWINFIDYFGLSIEADPSKVVKKNVHFVCIKYILRPSSVNPYLARKQLGEEFNSEPRNLCIYQPTKNISANIVPHISSTLRDLCVIFDKSILSRSPILAGADRAGTAYL